MANNENNTLSYVFYLFLAFIILAGVYVVTTYGSNKIYSYIFPKASTTNVKTVVNSPTSIINDTGVTTKLVEDSPELNCPNVLIRKGNLLLLINTRKPPEDGVNPIIFNDLDQYIHYVKVQRTTHNVHCPVLFLQEEANAQGEYVYRVRPGPFDQNSGSPAPNVNDIPVISNFFQGSPGTSGTFNLPRDAKTPSAFNASTIDSSVKFETSGSKFIDNTKLTNSENISTERAMNLPLSGNNVTVFDKPSLSPPSATLKYTDSVSAQQNLPMALSTLPNQVPIVQPPVVIQAPVTVQTPPSALPSNTVSFGTLPSNTLPSSAIPSTTLPSNTVPSGTLPPMTTPPTTPIFSTTIQTPYFNGSLGPYNGTPVDQISGAMTPPSSVTPFVDSSRDDGPYNQGGYPGFDPYGQFVGKYTNIDQTHDSTKIQAPLSDNPMDPNWGGVLYTRQQVMSGKYAENTVSKPIYGGSPNVMSIPSLMSNGGKPIYITNETTNCPDLKNMSTRSLKSAPESA